MQTIPIASDMPEQITDNLPTELPIVDVGDYSQGLPQTHAFANPQTIDKPNIPAPLVHSAKPLDIKSSGSICGNWKRLGITRLPSDISDRKN